MRVVGVYSFNKGQEVVEQKYPHLLAEVYQVLASVNAGDHKTKTSKEKTMHGKLLYNPRYLNKSFSEGFMARGWKKQKVKSEYSTKYYVSEYSSTPVPGAFREMDFLKEKLGVEVQFGKYAFMVYNICAKMTIFKNLGFIDTGIEIVPVKPFAEEMSSGVSYFEQFVWDLEHRGISNIDIPVMILGIESDLVKIIPKNVPSTKKSYVP